MNNASTTTLLSRANANGRSALLINRGAPTLETFFGYWSLGCATSIASNPSMCARNGGSTLHAGSISTNRIITILALAVPGICSMRNLHPVQRTFLSEVDLTSSGHLLLHWPLLKGAYDNSKFAQYQLDHSRFTQYQLLYLTLWTMRPKK